jgi:hypothetical protein
LIVITFATGLVAEFSLPSIQRKLGLDIHNVLLVLALALQGVSIPFGLMSASMVGFAMALLAIVSLAWDAVIFVRTFGAPRRKAIALVNEKTAQITQEF